MISTLAAYRGRGRRQLTEHPRAVGMSSRGSTAARCKHSRSLPTAPELEGVRWTHTSSSCHDEPTH